MKEPICQEPISLKYANQEEAPMPFFADDATLVNAMHTEARRMFRALERARELLDMDAAKELTACPHCGGTETVFQSVAIATLHAEVCHELNILLGTAEVCPVRDCATLLEPGHVLCEKHWGEAPQDLVGRFITCGEEHRAEALAKIIDYITHPLSQDTK
jgi:hypothetical protein